MRFDNDLLTLSFMFLARVCDISCREGESAYQKSDNCLIEQWKLGFQNSFLKQFLFQNEKTGGQEINWIFLYQKMGIGIGFCSRELNIPVSST